MEQLKLAHAAGELAFFNSLAQLREREAFARYLGPVSRAEWVVYAKRPFGGPEQVLEYLGRYTHRVAISNNRLVSFTGEHVTFHWKDYRHESRNRLMQLDSQEFVRRFLLHVLPPGFQRIRHYGLLANRTREHKLRHCRELLDAPEPVAEEHAVEEVEDYRDQYQRLTGISLRDCPACGLGQMVRINTLLPQVLVRGPP